MSRCSDWSLLATAPPRALGCGPGPKTWNTGGSITWTVTRLSRTPLTTSKAELCTRVQREATDAGNAFARVEAEYLPGAPGAAGPTVRLAGRLEEVAEIEVDCSQLQGDGAEGDRRVGGDDAELVRVDDDEAAASRADLNPVEVNRLLET